ncbi:MAG: UDP-N-acetylglucosamine 1-carboxyvinyltransferase [Candidatus Saccharimonadia bacterium]
MPNLIKITGGNPLVGEVTLSGAKNAATKMMIASLLTSDPVTLHNCPRIGDVDITAEICRAIGTKVSFDGSTVHLHTPKILQTTVKHLSQANRISVLAIPPLLHRAGNAAVPKVSGDKIGLRPVNYHLDSLIKMGAKIEETNKGYKAKATRLHGTSVTLPYPSVGSTENIILSAVLADGRTYIKNAAIEPEIMDLIKMLQQMGAIIEFRANRTIIIDGVERLSGVEYSVMADRNEAASYGVMAVATGGDILVKGARQEDLMTFLNTLRRIGADYFIEPDGIRFRRTNDALLTGVELETDTYPGFMTDWQQPMVVLLTQADGISVIHETVYEERFGYVETLKNMGASVTVFAKCLGELPCRFNGEGYKHSAVIKGPTPLHATTIVIPDIRAGMAQVIAALIADGTSELTGLEHLLRGYENLLDKLHAIGAQFEAK